MPDDVFEIVVRMSPEGAKETQEAMDEVSDSFDEAAEETGDAADELSGFARKFTGAGAVIGATLAGVALSILNKVPLVEEAFASIDAVLTAVGLKIDEVLREDDRFSSFSDDMFALSDAILALDVTPLVNFMALMRQFEALGPFAIIPAATLAAIDEFLFRLGLTEERGEFTQAALEALSQFLNGDFAGSWETLAAFHDRIMTRMLDRTNSWVTSMKDVLNDAVVDFRFIIDKWSIVLEESIRAAFDLALNTVKRKVNDVVAGIEGLINEVTLGLHLFTGGDLGDFDRVNLGRLRTRSNSDIISGASSRANDRISAARRTAESRKSDNVQRIAVELIPDHLANSVRVSTFDRTSVFGRSGF